MSNALSFKNQSEEVQREIKQRTKFNKYLHFIKRIEFEESGTKYIFKNRAITILISLFTIPFIILIDALVAFGESVMEQIKIVPGIWNEASIFIVDESLKIKPEEKDYTKIFRDSL